MLDIAGVLTLYAIAYLLTALFLRRTILGWLIIPVNTYALALIMMAAGSIVPFVILLLMTDGKFNRQSDWLMITVPFSVLDGEGTREQWRFSAIWAAVIGAITLPWIVMKWLAFCRTAPLRPRPVEEPKAQPQRVAEIVEAK